jgi:protein TonB
MFEQTFIDTGQRTRQPWTVFVSFVFQCFLVGMMVLVPLIYTEALPKQQLMSFLLAPPPPPAPPPPAAAAPVVKVMREIEDGRLIAPKAIPKTIAMVREDDTLLPAAPVGVVGGVPGGVSGGTIAGVIGSIMSTTPLVAPPPPPPKVVEAPKRIQVGGQVQQAKIISKPAPVYPQLARAARIQGTVRLEAIISRTGTIEALKVISGPPLLIEAATQAVLQWRYQPTFLNGEPVEVQTTIDVIFTLQ